MSLIQPSLLNPDNKPDEFEVFYEQLKEKNLELVKSRNLIKQETIKLRRRYKELNERLRLLTPSLEKNASIYQQLFNDTENSVKICTLKCMSYDARCPELDINVPAPRTILQNKLGSAINDGNATTTPTVQTKCRKKINIEPLNIQEVDEMAKREDTRGNSISETPNIVDVKNWQPKELVVKLEKLPREVLLEHLNDTILKSATASSFIDNSFNNITSFLTNSPSVDVKSFLHTSPKDNPGFVTSRQSRRNISKRLKIKERLGETCSSNLSMIDNDSLTQLNNDLEFAIPSTSQGTSEDPSLLQRSSKAFSSEKRLFIKSSPIKNLSNRPMRRTKPLKSFKEESLRAKKRQP